MEIMLGILASLATVSTCYPMTAFIGKKDNK